jgi:hypothetical protein
VADDHSATGEVLKRFLKRGQRFGIKVVSRLIGEQYVAAFLEHLRQMHTVPFTAR